MTANRVGGDGVIDGTSVGRFDESTGPGKGSRHLLRGVCQLLGAAVADESASQCLVLEQDGHADRGEDRRAGCVEKPGVDAVDEGVAGVGAGRPTGVDGDGEGGPGLVDDGSRGAREAAGWSGRRR